MKKTKFISENKKTKMWSIRSTKTGKVEKNFSTAQTAINFALADKAVTHISLKTQGIWVTDVKKNLRSFSQTDTRAMEIKKMKKAKKAAAARKKAATAKAKKVDKRTRDEIIQDSLQQADVILKERGEEVTYISRGFIGSLPLFGILIGAGVVAIILEVLGYF